MFYSTKTNSLVDDPNAEYHNIWATPGDSGFRTSEEKAFIHLHSAQQKLQN